MKLSKYFLPLLKDITSDAVLKSHILMLKSGMIKQHANGLYSFLPFGLKVLRKIEQIVESELDKVGSMRLSMPILQPEELWQESGRFDAYGPELLRIKDRHGKSLLYSPTNEEMVVDIFRSYSQSYKNLPMTLYQINWKFRDEVRPRFALMRAREFLMMDAYSFHTSLDCAKQAYRLYFDVYNKIFDKINIKCLATKADNGPIGGDLSHEFQVLADSGESKIYYDKNIQNILQERNIVSFEDVNKYYAATEDVVLDTENLFESRGIEVGHIFLIGDRYTKAMNINILDSSGNAITPYMATYGIGVSRLVAAAIEAGHDEKGIIWSRAITPFKAIIVNLDYSDENANNVCETIYSNLDCKDDILFDDTAKSSGEKFAVADLLGIPLQIIVGKRNLINKNCEIKIRSSNQRIILPIDNIYKFVDDFYNQKAGSVYI